MARTPQHRAGRRGAPAANGSDSASSLDANPGNDDRRTRSGWHPGVRLILVLVVLLPMLSTGVLLASDGGSAWSFRQKGQVVARDAAQLQVVATARAQMNALEVPMSAVSYASGVGISESELDSLLKPSVPYGVQLSQSASKISGIPTFSATPALRADVVELKTVIPRITAHTISYDSVNKYLTKMSNDIDSLWYRDFNTLQTDIAAWQPPGSFEVHASALRQTYAAFLAGGQEIEGGIFVLEGTGPSGAKQQLVQAAGEFSTATSEFVGHLSPKAQRAWTDLVNNPADKHFQATLHQGLTVALNNLPAPFLNNLQFAGSSERPALQYLAALDNLVVAASLDLQDSALSQASAASHHFISEIVFLGLLALASLGGVIMAGRVLTRPLKALAVAARQVHNGEFDLERLPSRGPREVVATTAAFNDMASTLKAVESKTVALATEDLDHPELLIPLPGRTGQALQASVNTLAARIRERELQRQLLHEAATHDRLTGLYNRAAVLDFLTNDVSRRRLAGETVAVLFIDLDRLKPLNDTYGHEAGDAAILVTAQSLLEATAECDVVGRLGGDEFLVVLCHEHSRDGEGAADRINRTIAGHSIPVQGIQVPLQASVGIALTRCDSATDPMKLVHEADEAMYEAKKAARAIRDQTPASQY
jgi:diguanylate cyclase (GGDEF)-like protein